MEPWMWILIAIVIVYAWGVYVGARVFLHEIDKDGYSGDGLLCHVLWPIGLPILMIFLGIFLFFLFIEYIFTFISPNNADINKNEIRASVKRKLRDTKNGFVKVIKFATLQA